MDKNHKPSILLGNGFNIALEMTCKIPTLKFHYEQILSAVISKIKADGGDDNLINYLCQNSVRKEEKIQDIELLLWLLKYSKDCIKYTTPTYCTSTPKSLAMIESHRELLRNYVIDIMTDKNYHPKYQDIFNNDNEANIKKCGDNLLDFNRIFTINYDLILYWLLNHLKMLENKEDNMGHSTFRDGFTARESFKPRDNDGNIIENLYGYLSTNNQGNVLFLHGALHLLQKDNETYKVVTTGADMSLSILRNYLLTEFTNFSNLLVFDATSTEKVSCIYENSYLTKAYDKLVPIDGDLIIYGCGVFKNKDELSNDEHLWQRIITSSVKNLYVSCPEETAADLYSNACRLQLLLKRYRYNHAPVDIHFFSHKQVNIWTSEDFYNDVLKNSGKSYRLV